MRNGVAAEVVFRPIGGGPVVVGVKVDGKDGRDLRLHRGRGKDAVERTALAVERIGVCQRVGAACEVGIA